MKTKICTKCGIEKEESEFSPTKRKYDNKEYNYLRHDCKECRRKQKREWNKNNKDIVKKYNTEYIKNNIGKIRAYYKNNKDKIKEYNAKYRQNNMAKIRAYYNSKKQKGEINDQVSGVC